METVQKWKTVIEPSTKRINLNLRELFQYRDLIWLFVKRDFTSKYKQTILGPLWAVIQPLLTTVVFTIVFGNLANLTTLDAEVTDGAVIPSFLFYMTGTIIWSYFSSTVTVTSNTFITNRAIMGKVYYPRMVSPIASALANLISFFIQLGLFVIILVICVITGVARLQPSLYLLLLPILIMQMVMLSTAVGIIISSVTTKYRDLAMLVGFGLQLWQYLSPVAYGLSLIPGEYMWLYMLNPVTPIITTVRYGFFGTGYFSLIYCFISLLVTLFLFLIGLLLFNKIERTFMDTV